MPDAALKVRPVADEKKLAGPAMKGFFLIMERWGVDNDTARILLGAPPERTFYLWKAGQVVRVPMVPVLCPEPPLVCHFTGQDLSH